MDDLETARTEIARLTAEVERLRDNIEADRAVRSLARMNDEAKIARLEEALREITRMSSTTKLRNVARAALAPASEAGEWERLDTALLVPGRASLPPSEWRCSCTNEERDSECARHPSCGECGEATTHPVDACAEHAPIATAPKPVEACATCAGTRRVADPMAVTGGARYRDDVPCPDCAATKESSK
jgi:hypothetical protein